MKIKTFSFDFLFLKQFTILVFCDNINLSFGELSEWSNVPVSKTGVAQVTGGSNPPLSAKNYELN